MTTYETAITQIKNGDMIFMHSSPVGFGLTALSRYLTKLLTKSDIYHCVIAMWMTAPSGLPRLMAVETATTGGKRIVPMEFYKAGYLEIIPLPAGVSFGMMEGYGFQNIGFQSYSFWSMAMIGLREFLGLPRMNLRGQVCSELCADMWRIANVKIGDDQVSPGKLKAELLTIGCTTTLTVNMP